MGRQKDNLNGELKATVAYFCHEYDDMTMVIMIKTVLDKRASSFISRIKICSGFTTDVARANPEVVLDGIIDRVKYSLIPSM